MADGDDAAERRRHGVGRPAVPQGVRERLRELVLADADAPPLEYLRQLREEGVPLAETTFYRSFVSRRSRSRWS